MDDLTILILLPYYNRPWLVRNTLESIKESRYKNWKLFFVDDDSRIPGYPTLCDVLGMPYDKDYIHYTKIHYSITNPKEKEGSTFGRYFNYALKTIEADLAIFLCDDDCLHPQYLSNLNKWFNKHPEEMYGYSHVAPFSHNRNNEWFVEDWRYALNSVSKDKLCNFWLNKTGRIDPYCRLDASQVCFRTKAYEDGIRFPSPQTVALDAAVFGQLCEKYGSCDFMGFYGQYKRQHDNQLGLHSGYDRVD